MQAGEFHVMRESEMHATEHALLRSEPKPPQAALQEAAAREATAVAAAAAAVTARDAATDAEAEAAASAAVEIAAAASAAATRATAVAGELAAATPADPHVIVCRSTLPDQANLGTCELHHRTYQFRQMPALVKALLKDSKQGSDVRSAPYLTSLALVHIVCYCMVRAQHECGGPRWTCRRPA